MPITETPEWHALDAALRGGARHPPPRPVRRRPAAGRAPGRRGRRPLPRLLEEPVTDETLRLLLELGAPGRPARAHRRDVPRRQDQRHRGPRRAAHRAARARGRGRSWSTARTSCPQVHAVLRKMADFSERVRSGQWRGHTGERSATSSTSASAAPTSARRWPTTRCSDYSRRDMTFRFVSNVDGTDFWECHPRPRPRRDAVHRRVEDVHHPRDAHQRAQRPRVAARRARGDESAVAKHFVAVSTNADEVAKFGIDTANMFEFWDWVGGRYSYDSRHRPVADGRDRPRAVRRDARRASASIDEHFRTAPFEQNLPVLHGPHRHLVRRLLRRRRPRRSSRTASTSSASPRTSSSSTWRATASRSTSTATR